MFNVNRLRRITSPKNDNIYLKKIRILSSDQSINFEISTNVCGPYTLESYRKVAFKSVHETSHPGVRASQKLITYRFFRPGLNSDVGLWTRTCIQCQKSEVGRHIVSECQQFPEAKRLCHVHLEWVAKGISNSGPFATHSRQL